MGASHPLSGYLDLRSLFVVGRFRFTIVWIVIRMNMYPSTQVVHHSIIFLQGKDQIY